MGSEMCIRDSSEVDNEDNSQYDFGIGTSGNAVGQDVEMFAIGLVQWF